MAEAFGARQEKLVAVISIGMREDGTAVVVQAQGHESLIKSMLFDAPRLIEELKQKREESSRIVIPTLVPPQGVS